MYRGSSSLWNVSLGFRSPKKVEKVLGYEYFDIIGVIQFNSVWNTIF